MPLFRLVYEGTAKEVYEVEADSEEEARDTWPNYGPIHMEMIDGEIVSAEEIDEHDV